MKNATKFMNFQLTFTSRNQDFCMKGHRNVVVFSTKRTIVVERVGSAPPARTRSYAPDHIMFICKDNSYVALLP